MTWKFHPKEFANAMMLAPLGRYEYLVKKVADQQELWSLWEGGWALLGDKERGEFVPIWPHPDFAKAYASGEWSGYVPKLIQLDDWLGKWTPGMQRDHRKVAIFPIADELSITADPGELKAALEYELRLYE